MTTATILLNLGLALAISALAATAMTVLPNLDRSDLRRRLRVARTTCRPQRRLRADLQAGDWPR